MRVRLRVLVVLVVKLNKAMMMKISKRLMLTSVRMMWMR